MATMQFTRRLGDTIHLYAVWKGSGSTEPFRVADGLAFLFPKDEVIPSDQTYLDLGPKFFGPENGFHIRDVMARHHLVDIHKLVHPLFERPTPRDYIALLPHATQSLREWPTVRWNELRVRLEAMGLPHVWLPMKGRGFPMYTLPEMAELLSRARAAICVDSGPIHLADALGIPTVGIYGGTSTACYGPYQHRHLCVDFHQRFWMPEVPYDTGRYNKRKDVMGRITVDDVIVKLKEALEGC